MFSICLENVFAIFIKHEIVVSNFLSLDQSEILSSGKNLMGKQCQDERFRLEHPNTLLIDMQITGGTKLMIHLSVYFRFNPIAAVLTIMQGVTLSRHSAKISKHLKKCTRHCRFRYITRHNPADSVPTSNLVCIKEVAIKTTFYCWNNLLHLQLSMMAPITRGTPNGLY